jgi:hypothetical protein
MRAGRRGESRTIIKGGCDIPATLAEYHAIEAPERWQVGYDFGNQLPRIPV